MEVLQQNMGYVLMTVIIAWMLWRRVIAPKLSGVKSMSAADYLGFRDEEHTLIDVRSAGEWKSGHPAKAKHVPLGELSNHLGNITKDKPIVVICASGNRSAMAATILAKHGFEPVYNFSGGMGSWRGAGLPVKTGA